MNGMSATNLVIHQQIQKYRNELNTWSRQVVNSRELRDALRFAGHKPNAGNLIRSLSGMTAPDKGRAERIVEEALMSKIKDIQAGDPAIPEYMRFAQGHWPRVWKVLRDKREAS
jgi:hypothetical protein